MSGETENYPDFDTNDLIPDDCLIDLRSDNTERIRGALARAYCTERNKHKVLDPDLIEDMVIELNKLTARQTTEGGGDER